MVNARLQMKWFLLVSGLLGLLAVALAASAIILESGEADAELVETTSAEAELAATAIRNDLYFGRIPGLRQTMKFLVRSSSFTRAQLYNRDAETLVGIEAEAFPSPSEFGERARGDFAPQVRRQGQELQVRVPVVVNAGDIIGTLLLARPAAPKALATSAAILRYSLLAALGWLLTSALAWPAIRLLIRPLRELEAACRLDGGGNADLPVRSPDEVGQVALAFKRLAHELEQVKGTHRESSQHLAFILQETPVGYIEWDKDFRVLRWNKAAERIFGYSPEEAKGRTAADLIIPEGTGGNVAQAMHILLRGEGGRESFNRHHRADGQTVFCEWHNTLIRDREGTISAVASIVLDVTETTVAQRKLKEALEVAHKATEAKSQFLANMSHEIRTPMNGVIGLTELLLKTDLNEQQREYLQVIHSSGEVLIAIIKDILDLSKIESGTFTLAEETFDLEGCLRGSVRLFSGQLEEKGLEGICEIGDNLPRFVRGDANRLRQILYNLLSNAIKFTNEGYIRLESWKETVNQDRLRLFVSITDTGSGIPEETARDIFEPFKQGDTSSTRSHGGTGLGLTICQRLCRLMNGDIHLDHTSEKGTSFTFHIELKRAEAFSPTFRKNSQAKEELPENLRILLVEDNAVNRMVAKRIVKELGYDCDTAKDGSEAFGKVIEQPYDVLFMDLQMPVMDGFEATEKIRARFGRRHRIVALTASAVEGDRERCLAAGMDDYLSKPIHIENVRNVLLGLWKEKGSWI